jgi:hypothetical protein
VRQPLFGEGLFDVTVVVDRHRLQKFVLESIEFVCQPSESSSTSRRTAVTNSPFIALDGSAKAHVCITPRSSSHMAEEFAAIAAIAAVAAVAAISRHDCCEVLR